MAAPSLNDIGTESGESTLAGMSKVQKLASLLVLLGQDTAAQVLTEFDEQEVEMISTEMAKIHFIPIEMQKELLDEFSSVTLEAVTSAVGGPQFAREVLEKSLGGYKASEVISRVSPVKAKSIDTTVLREIMPRQLVNLLRREQVQTWAMILSYMDPNRCAEVLALVPSDMRPDIVERIATMEPISGAVVQGVFTYLKNRVSNRQDEDVASSGGTKVLADILNTLDDNTSKQVLEGLEERNPDLTRSVKKLLFVFEDIATLDKATITRLLREVDFHALAVAMKTASDKVHDVIIGALSKRAAESIAEEIRFMPPVKLSDVEAAQEQVIEVLRGLEASGEITLSKKGGGGETVV